MPELLAALCSVMLATGTVASSPLPTCGGDVTLRPEAVRSQDAQKSTPAAHDTQTPLQKAQALLAKVDELAQAGDASTTIAQRIELLGGADAQCDAADAAGKTAEERREAFTLRYKLANRAYFLDDWGVGVQLYSDAVTYCLGAEGWGAEDPFTFTAKRALAACLSSSQRSKPWSERDYKPALAIFRELAEIWDARLKKALESPGEDPIDELIRSGEAHDDLGVTLADALQREEAGAQLKKAHGLLCDNAKRLTDPDLLRKICGDSLQVLELVDSNRLIEDAIRALKQHFPARRDLLLDMRADKTIQWLSFNEYNPDMISEARRLRDEALDLDDDKWIPPIHVHALHTIGQVFLLAGLPADAEPILLRAVELAHKLGIPPTDPNAAAASERLGSALIGLGRYEEAIRIFDAEPDLTLSRVGRATARTAAGDLEGALDDLNQARVALEAGVVTPQGWQAADFHLHNLFACRLMIGRLHILLGNTSLAIANLEDVWSAAKAAPRPLAGELALAGFPLNLAEARTAAGDLQGAYPLYKDALSIITTHQSVDELFVQDFRWYLGRCAFLLGHYSEAEQLQRAAFDACIRAQRKDRAAGPAIGLADALAAMERWDEAQKAALDGLDATGLAAFHDPVLIGSAKSILGIIALGKGQAPDAARLLREGIKMIEAAPPEPINHVMASRYRGKLVNALAAEGDAGALKGEISSMAADAGDRLRQLSAFSARERGEIVAGMLRQAEQIAALQSARPAAIEERSLFEWLASLRAAGGPLELGRAYEGKPEIAKLKDRYLLARRHVAALSFESYRERGAESEKLFAQAVSDSDAAEKALFKVLPAERRFEWLTTKFIAVPLRKQSALGVSIQRVRALPPLQKEDKYIAFVLDGGENLRRIDLGPAAPIEEKIQAWRRAVTQERGKPVANGEPDLRALGEELRAAVLDRVLKGATERRIFLCLDDALHTIPWDSLPAAPAPANGSTGANPAPATARGATASAQEDRLVGDDYRIAELPSFRDLIVATKRNPRQPALLAIGDIDYSAPGETVKQSVLADRPMRGSSEIFGPYDTLVYSAEEIGGIAKSFEEAQKRKPTVLTGEKATKKALFQFAPSATCLHISTHGYFAPEDIPSLGGTGQSSMLEAVTGFAPLSLCGLALAGANRDVGALEEVTGIVTAEELAGLDLSACQLAVLSGCKTDIGVRRAGQDLASLKSALHAAGAANVVASLWRVPDDKTSELMRRFYGYLWKEGKAPDEALWLAKSSFRKLRLQAWAGWIFSGVPEGK